MAGYVGISEMVIQEQNTKREGWKRSPSLSTMIEWRQQARSFEQIEGIVWYAEANTLRVKGPRSG